MIEQGFHDNTEHNYVFAFVFKKIAGKIPGNHRWGNTKAGRKKQYTKIQSKRLRREWILWSRG